MAISTQILGTAKSKAKSRLGEEKKSEAVLY